MRLPCMEKMLADMSYRPPPADPVEEAVELAMAHGVSHDLIHAVIEALDDHDAAAEEREAEEDGGSIYEGDTGLAVNEYVPVRAECRCCGHSHADEPILIA